MSTPPRLGRYAVRRRIGSGGFATVWLAYDEELDSPVAVKVLAENWTEDADVRRRFLEEGRYLRRVESPHVVSVYDAGQLEDRRPYLVMSYADQGSLADRLAVEGLTPTQALEVVRHVGAGLSALHERDIVHRDVKPANVLFRTTRGRVVAMVGDLGLGKALDGSSRLTMIAGTPAYVAPEQARAESPDARADQYSLAALAHLLLSGRSPYAHASLQQAAHPGAPAPLSTPERPFPDAAEQVVRRALAVEREERFADVDAFVEALAEALAPTLIGAQSAPAASIAVDPHRTQPGRRPSPAPTPAPTPTAGAAEGGAVDDRPQAGRPGGRRWVRRGALVAAGVVALAAGGAGGWAVQRDRLPGTVTLADAGGSLSVAVPRAWRQVVSDGPWSGPTTLKAAGSGATFDALSVGTRADWTDPDVAGQGAFLGILPGAGVPDLMPGHPECSDAQPAVIDEGGPGRLASTTVVHEGCPGGYTVERVQQVSSNLLLWVQVRSADLATARQVLDTVETSGF